MSAKSKMGLAGERIEWRFNLERAPWWGGFFERMVGTVKRCLRKVIGNAKLSYDELNTCLIEVEATINNRPLTYMYEEPGSEPLTPSHLMYGHRLNALPDSCRIVDNIDSVAISRRYRYLLTKLDNFWTRWRREYLTDLRELHRNREQRPHKVKVHDIVLVHDDNAKRLLWKMGKVVRIIYGKDGIVRGADVRVITRNKPYILSRPLQKLYPLEIEERSEGKVTEKEGTEKSEEDKGRPQRPQRAAALDARWRNRICLTPASQGGEMC